MREVSNKSATWYDVVKRQCTASQVLAHVTTTSEEHNSRCHLQQHTRAPEYNIMKETIQEPCVTQKDKHIYGIRVIIRIFNEKGESKTFKIAPSISYFKHLFDFLSVINTEASSSKSVKHWPLFLISFCSGHHDQAVSHAGHCNWSPYPDLGFSDTSPIVSAEEFRATCCGEQWRGAT